METIKENALGAKLIPLDATSLIHLARTSFEKSREDSGFIDSRVISVAAAVAAAVLAALQIPVYVARSLVNAALIVINLNANNEMQKAADDFKGALQCLAFSALTTLLIAAAIISPHWAFSYFETAPIEEKPDEEEKTRENEPLISRLGTLRSQLDSLSAAHKLELQDKIDEVARLEVELQSARTVVPVANAEASAAHAQEKQRLEHQIVEARKTFAEEKSQLLAAQGEHEKARSEHTSQLQRLEQELGASKDRFKALEDERNAKIVILELEVKKAQEELTSGIKQLTEDRQSEKEKWLEQASQLRAECEERLRQAQEGLRAALEEKQRIAVDATGPVIAEDHSLNDSSFILASEENQRLKEERAALSDDLVAELEEKRDQVDALERELQQLVARIKASEALKAEQLEAELASYKDGQTSKLSFVLNSVRYEVIANSSNPNSITQFNRLHTLVRVCQEGEHRHNLIQILKAFRSEQAVSLVDRSCVVIDLSEIIDANYIPDVTTIQAAGSTGALVEVTHSWLQNLTGEQHDPTKYTKYSSYMNEMKFFCAKLFPEGWATDLTPSAHPLHKLIIEIRNYIMKDSHPGSHSNPRDRYQKFCAALDEACLLLQTTENRAPHFDVIERIIDEIVIARWMKVSLDGFMNRLLEHVETECAKRDQREPIIPRQFKFHTFGKELIELNDQVDHAPKYTKKGSLDLAAQQFTGEMLGGDFTGGMNTPNVRSLDTYSSESGEQQVVVYSRHGSPTSGKKGTLGALQALGVNITAKLLGKKVGNTLEDVVPNYERFIAALSEGGEAAFFAVHQQLDGGTEMDRVLAIMALQERHENVAVLVQPIGQGHLGTKSGPYEDANTFDQLKQAIIENFFENGEGSPADRRRCQLPQFVLKDASYKDRMEEIIDFVRANYFDEKDDFSNAAVWEEFILIFFTYQREDLMFRFQGEKGLKVVYKTTPCKDFQDRGGKVALTFACIAAMCSDRFDSQEFMREQAVHVTMAPFMIKRTGMLPGKLAIIRTLHPRLVRAYENRDRLAAIKEFKFGGTHRLVGHRTDARPHQKAILDLAEFKTREEIRDRLHWIQGAGRSEVLTVSGAELLAEFTQMKGKRLPATTPIYMNGTRKATTLGEFLSTLGEHSDRLHQCLALATNGVAKSGKDQMHKAMDRPEQQLALSKLKNLRFEITTTGDQTYKINMCQDCDYQVTGEITDGRFEGEDLNPGTRLALITTTLSVEFNAAIGNFTKEGSFNWWVSKID